MGSNSSKTCRIVDNIVAASSSQTSKSNYKRKRGKIRHVFVSSCFGSSSKSNHHSHVDDDDDFDQVSDHQTSGTHIQETVSKPDEVKVECYQTAKIDESDGSCVASNAEIGEWTHVSRSGNVTRAGGSSSQASSDGSLNRSSRFLSRFSFVPGSVSFRLNRAASVGSSRAYPSSPTSHRSTYEADSDNLNSVSLYRTSIRSHNGDSSINLPSNASASTSTSSSSLQGEQTVSAQDLVNNERTRPDVSFPTFESHLDVESLNRRPGDLRNGSRESEDRNVRFSRTLSVGRLRDRVLRRTSFSDLNISPLQQDHTSTSYENPINSLISSPYPLHSMTRSFYASQNNDVETLHPRDVPEHRSNFLERRRRIRSQVRALQRLGNRFENLSGHESHCIRSGQHRIGRCSCRIGSRDPNLNDDGGARASISRIVMLAEALFEVLDEIHQQSVVLSSRPSVLSIGSIPAPNEVVDSLPVKVYNKSTKFQCEEVGQCYICLVEYEGGDEMRILPCNHEFHTKCIDKWLKEIHRVCPLCRGDICRAGSSSVES